MKSIPNMTDMRRNDADKLSEAMKDGVLMPSMSDMPDYDCGLCISFNKESLDKLDMDGEVQAGDYLHLHSFARVTSVHMKPGSDEIDSVSLCLTHISAAEDEDQENEESEDEAV